MSLLFEMSKKLRLFENRKYQCICGFCVRRNRKILTLTNCQTSEIVIRFHEIKNNIIKASKALSKLVVIVKF